VDLALKPEPLLHDESEMQNPKRRSPAAVVVIVPLETLEDEPLAWALPSKGETSLIPLYSKIYIAKPGDPGTALNVTVMLSDPPRILPAKKSAVLCFPLGELMVDPICW